LRIGDFLHLRIGDGEFQWTRFTAPDSKTQSTMKFCSLELFSSRFTTGEQARAHGSGLPGEISRGPARRASGGKYDGSDGSTDD
jgi:hypothetical protein